MRSAVIWWAFLGCAGTPTPPIPAPVSPPFEPVVLETRTPLPCSDPSRAERPFDLFSLGHGGPGVIGQGLAVEDFDGDGLLDVIATTSEGAEFWSRITGPWALRAAAFDGIDLSDASGASAADFDADGHPDVLITRFGQPNRLLRNNGNRFTDVTQYAGLSDAPSRTMSASWADFDGDGWLDLAIGNYGGRPEDVRDPHMEPGDPNVLYRNLGNGRFADVSRLLPPATQDTYTFNLSFVDLNADSFPELLNISDFGWIRPTNFLWNRSDRYELDDGTAGIHPNYAGMGLAIGDINRDGTPDFIQTSFGDLSALLSVESDFSTSGMSWAEYADVLHLSTDQSFGWGAQLADLNNDSTLDLVAGFGYWSEYNNPSAQPDEAWLFIDDHFEPVGHAWALDHPGATRGVVLADLDLDGHIDIIKRVIDEPLRIQRSRCDPHTHWVEVRLRDDTTPNRRGIGAMIVVSTEAGTQRRWLDAGSSSLFSSHPPIAHLGLGPDELIHRLEIHWPDGEVSRFDEVPADRFHTVRRRRAP